MSRMFRGLEKLFTKYRLRRGKVYVGHPNRQVHRRGIVKLRDHAIAGAARTCGSPCRGLPWVS